MKHRFAPSLMCMNILEMRAQMDVLNKRADILHVDIMDGHFVKNITLSPMFIEQIRDIAVPPIDAHLMVENPADFIDMVAAAGANYITPHAETINKDAFRVINHIRDLGCKVGIVLNPATPFSCIEHYIDLIDKLTVLTVDPGFAGQKFIENMLKKIEEARNRKEKRGYNYLIEIDGSCNEGTYAKLAQAGAEVFIVGTSGLFKLDEDLAAAWEKMLSIFKKCVPENR